MTSAQTTDRAETAEPAEEVPAARQPGSLVELFVEGQAPYAVRVGNRELIAYEKAAARHKEWPPRENGRHFAMTYCTWSAARRAGRTDATFEQWQELLEDYDIVQDVPADPTR
jgi:hypothetical protein